MQILTSNYQKQQNQDLHKKNRMILNSNDPKGVKLFSKCARNYACKTIKNNHPKQSKTTPSSPRNIYNKNNAQQKNIKQFFSKQQSRQQREKRYKKFETPPVGQYNPIYKNSRAKMVWNILKVYNMQKQFQKESRQRKHFSLNITNDQNDYSEKYIEKNHSNNKKKLFTQPINQPSHKFQGSVKNEESIIKKEQNFISLKHSQSKLYQNKKNISNGVYINMSKMVGRDIEKLPNQSYVKSVQSVDLNQSIKITKQRLKTNVIFDKQISREKINGYKNKNTPSNYDYDYRIIKPQKNRCLNKFSKSVGRQNSKKNIQSSIKPMHSYMHYQYDSYVWKSKSKIYKNTKILINDFSKQLKRRS